MKLTVVGSGTAAPGKPCSSYWLATPPSRLLLDCGPGAVHSLAQLKLPWPDLTHLVLTHFHNDHTGDVAFLFFALHYGLTSPRQAPLAVVGPRGTRKLFDRLAAAFGHHLRRPKFPVTFTELDHGEAYDAPGVRILACRTPHTDASLAYRFEADGVAIGYTGDTGESDALGDFMAGVNVLVAECSMPEGDVIPSHLSPARLARLALRARPQLLVATHVYPTLERDEVPALVRQAGWDGKCIVACEGLQVP